MKKVSRILISTSAAMLLGSPCIAGPIEDVNKAEDYRYTVEIAKNKPEIEKILGAEFFYNQPDGTYKDRSAYIEFTLKDNMIQAERYSRGLNRIIMGYQEILDDTEGVLHRCHQALSSDGQLNTSFSKPGASSEPLSFIDPQLHRQKVDAGIPDWCHEETACRCYTLAMRIFDSMIEHQSSASKLGPRMDDLWRELVSFLP